MADGARGAGASIESGVEPAGPAADEPGARRVRFPSALTVLALLLVAMWVASFFIPSGVYELHRRHVGAAGRP
jgi:hypothetical protein